jgi:hypothetical protein
VLQLVVKCTHDVVGHRLATSWVHYTTSCNTKSSAPEDGQNNCPKHVKLIEIINKSLLLHLVGCLHYSDFHDTSHLSIFRKSVEKIQVCLKSNNNNRDFT